MRREADGDLPWIDAARTRRAREAGKWREAHARISALAVLDSAGARAAAEVQSDDVEAALVLLEEVGRRPRDECVAYPVKPILPQLVLPGNVLVDGVRGNVCRDGLVELRVEASNVVRGWELLDARIDNAEGCTVVKRREIAEGLDVMVCILGDELGVVIVTTMNDAMAGNGNVVLGGNVLERVVVDECVQ